MFSIIVLIVRFTPGCEKWFLLNSDLNQNVKCKRPRCKSAYIGEVQFFPIMIQPGLGNQQWKVFLYWQCGLTSPKKQI